MNFALNECGLKPRADSYQDTSAVPVRIRAGFSRARFVSGHGFSRAEKMPKKEGL